MEEKVLIKSEKYYDAKAKKQLVIAPAIFVVFVLFSGIIELMNNSTKPYGGYADPFEAIFLPRLIVFALIYFIVFFIYLIFNSYELTVTNKRIYGKVIFGKRVDLPVDSVSAIATTSLLKGVSVSTSSGRISFLAIRNADKIYKVINNILIERQQEKATATVVATTPKIDEVDQLKKYKDLLDSGVITTEEFEAKKKQLLGL